MKMVCKNYSEPVLQIGTENASQMTQGLKSDLTFSKKHGEIMHRHLAPSWFSMGSSLWLMLANF